jgi:hypothetical protein
VRRERRLAAEFDTIGFGDRDGRVAVYHGFILRQKSASEKANFIKGTPMMQIF